MSKQIYYLPGHGGHLATGLGQALLSRGFEVVGRETQGSFRNIPFGEQIAVIAEDLKSAYWHQDARIVANSYGAYLFLHAQSLLTPFPGKVLLLSPIVGQFSTEDSTMGFIPPRAEKLLKQSSLGAYPKPLNCEIHVGERDWQSNPKNVVDFALGVGLQVVTVPGAGHDLGKVYVSSVLDRWLNDLISNTGAMSGSIK